MFLNKVRNTNVQFVSKRFNWSVAKMQLLKELFGVPLNKSGGFEKLDLNERQLRESADFCENLGFSKEEWIRHPNLFKADKYHLEFQYLNLKEGGFVDINPAILSSSRVFISKKVSILKQYNFIPKDVNVAEKFVSHLEIPKNQLKIDDITDERKYEEIYRIILLRYLAIKFNLTEDNLKKYDKPTIKNEAKSFVLIQKNFSYLDEIGIPRDRVFTSRVAVTTHPDCNRELLRKVSKLGDLNFLYHVRKYPLLLTIKYKCYEETYGHLKKLKFSDKTIQNCIQIFLHHPKTVKIRLIEIQSIPELNIFPDSVQTLRLVIHHNQARSKLAFLNKINFKHQRFSILNGTNQAFKNYIENEFDANYYKEVYLLLEHLLQNADRRVIDDLKKHVRYCQVPLLEIEKTYNFIRSCFKFSNESIAGAVQILLYPSDNFEKIRKDILTNYGLERRPTEIEMLNLMIYHMEKDSRFLGCAAETLRKFRESNICFFRESASKSGIVDNEPIYRYELN